MKRGWLGAWAGFLTSLIVMAISFLMELGLGLPFFPFDLFDWLSRHLPGGWIEFGLRNMITLITALHLGPTASTAKLAEQIQALGLVGITGVLFGLALTWVCGRREPWLLAAGRAGGALLWLGMVVVELSLAETPSLSVIYGLLWLAFLLVGWGGVLARILRGFLVFSHVPPAADEPQSAVLGQRLTRRNLLVLLGSGLVSAVVLGLGLAKTGTTGAETITGGAGEFIPPDLPYGPEYTSGPAASPSPATLAARIAAAPGTRAEVDTPAGFYRVDINTIPPAINAETWRLQLNGMVEKPLSLTLEEVWARPSVTQAVTLACISNPVGGDLISTNYWTGLRFRDLLTEAGLKAGAQEIAITAKDGFYEGLPVAEALDERTLLVYAMNGKPLTVGHGFPLRLYAPGHYGMKLPKWITNMQVVDHAVSGYWVDRGWSETAVPQTTSVIDTTAITDTAVFWQNGLFPLGGIAYAGARGISKVELQIDGGDWVPAELRAPALSPLTWVQWRYDWKPVTGSHVLHVRATDGQGVLQDANFSYPQPEGATGMHEVAITV